MTNMNDTKLANKIQGLYDVKTICDDGFLHVYTKNQNTADDIQTHFGHMNVSDGSQDGSVQIYVNDVLVHDNI